MPNNNVILITRPEYDPATEYLSDWCELIIREAEQRNFKIVQLKNKDAKRDLLEKRIEKNDPALILFNGHGESDRILGDKNTVLIKVGENEEILKKRIIHSLSCNSAKELGLKSVEAGAKAFIGYIGKFVFLQDDQHTATPRKDKIAEHFLNAANVAPISLIKGNTVKESFEKAQNSFEKAIYYFEGHYNPENSHILFWLRYDKKIQKFYGNENAILSD